MKTKEEIKSLGNQWALDNADETMATNSSLNKGFRGGYTQCQEDMADDYHNGYLQGLKDKAFELSDKKYTEEYLRKAIIEAQRSWVGFPNHNSIGAKVEFFYDNADEIIEFLNEKK